MRKILLISIGLFSVFTLQACAGDLKPGTEFQDCEDCPMMVVIPKGENMLGNRPYDKDVFKGVSNPLRKFIAEKNFAVSKFEVTRKLYNVCVLDGACKGEKEVVIVIEQDGKQHRFITNKDTLKKHNYPIPVSWQDAKKYADWLSKKTGRKYRLLSSDEWEYVARGGTKTIFWWGDDFKFDQEYCRDCVTDMVKYRMMSFKHLPVGMFKKNPYGLYDMLGNLKEWVSGCLLIKLMGIDGTDPKNCRFRGLMGGKYSYPRKYIRPSKPSAADIQNINIKAAIRVVVDIKPENNGE